MTFRNVIFFHEMVSDCWKKDKIKTLKGLAPCIFFHVISYFAMGLPSFEEESSVHFFMMQMSYGVVILRLMISNMSKVIFDE